jgi:hypothetical protein
VEQQNSFMFLCTTATEPECLEKLLVGTTQANAVWAMSIRVGDDIYLFNFHTGVVRGPYRATSAANCYDSGAWGGQFPIQVKIAETALTRKAWAHARGAPDFLRKKRPHGKLEARASSLRVWLEGSGERVNELRGRSDGLL